MPTIRDELVKMCQQEYARGHARSDGEMRLEEVLRRLQQPSDAMRQAIRDEAAAGGDELDCFAAALRAV